MTRQGYLDWLRGVAMLLMIEAHTMDAWTLPSDRDGWPYRAAIVLGGFAAPAFCSWRASPWRWPRCRVSAAARPRPRWRPLARRRGWQIFGLAFLFRLQALAHQRRPVPAVAAEGGHPERHGAGDGAGGRGVGSGARSAHAGRCACWPRAVPIALTGAAADAAQRGSDVPAGLAGDVLPARSPGEPASRCSRGPRISAGRRGDRLLAGDGGRRSRGRGSTRRLGLYGVTAGGWLAGWRRCCRRLPAQPTSDDQLAERSSACGWVW